MREILFRGKVADEPNEWVQGYLLPNNVIWQISSHENSKCCGVGQFAVIPETVGQYTGLTDKNGKMIFEGDICNDSIGVRFMVKWDADNALFIGRTIGGYGKDGYYFAPQRIVYVGREPKVTVIGNAYDNPELLKGEE